MPKTLLRKGWTFEEFSVGDTFVTAGRTVTEADIVAFAGLSGDFTQLHTNVEAAREGIPGERIAHGLLGLSIASGLLAQLGFTEGTIPAFRELTWKFRQPIFIGDTIRATATVTGTRLVPRLGGGLVKLDVAVTNQAGASVQRGTWTLLIASRPAQDA